MGGRLFIFHIFRETLKIKVDGRKYILRRTGIMVAD